MSKIAKHQPNDLESFESLVKSSCKDKTTVIFVDGTYTEQNFARANKPEVSVVDLSLVLECVECKETGKPGRKPQRAKEPQNKCRVVDEDEDPQDSFFSCFEETSTKHRKKLKVLQGKVGKTVRMEIEEFENWGETQQQLVIAAYPETKDDVRSLIRAAKESNLHLRCKGSGHSWATIFADKGQVLLHLNKLQSDYPNGAKIKLDEETNQADVMAGTTTGDLKQFLLDNNRSFPANVVLDVVTNNGVIATGSHGTGWDALTPGDYVTKMRIFDSDGNLRVYTKEDPEMMKAVSANFGAFGVIYDMTLQLMPRRSMLVRHVYIPAKDLLNEDTFKKYIESNWSVQLFWFAFNSVSLFDEYDPMEDEILLRLVNDDTSGEPEEDEEYYKEKTRMDYITTAGFKAASTLYRTVPRLTPMLCDAAFNLAKDVVFPPDRDLRQALPHSIHFRKYIHTALVGDLEFAFDLQNDYAKVITVIKVVQDTVVRYKKAGKYPFNITLEMRWMAYSNSFMSPASIGNPENGGSGHVFYIEVLSHAGSKHWQEFCIDVAQQWMAYGGVPHLAKEWQFVPNCLGHLKKKMGKGFVNFKKQLQKSKADPKGVFCNSTVSQLIG